MDLARDGYRVGFTYRRSGTGPEATLAAISAVAAPDAPPLAFAADNVREGETAAAIASAEEALGRIDAYVHAVGPMTIERFERSSLGAYRAMIESNLTSAVEGAFAILPGMRARGFGRLVYFAMNGSHVTQPARGLAFYGAAKAGLVAFARTLALEEARRGITVNVVEPGDIRDKETDRAGARLISAKNPTGHAGSWQDVAGAVRFLISDAAGFINGMTIGVNGGLVEPHE